MNDPKVIPTVSICMSAFNKPDLLRKTLESIYRQTPPFAFEVIVTDDGSEDAVVSRVCEEFSEVRCIRIEREPIFRNPCTARNVAYRAATADILILQSDEVLHVTGNAIQQLVVDLRPGTFVLAQVHCLNRAGKIDGVFTGPARQVPFFFLGAMFREDLYAIGGNDEEFAICPAYEDAWFGDCLTRGRGLTPVYTTRVRGHHQWHTYCSRPEDEGPSRRLYYDKVAQAEAGTVLWQAAEGPWPYESAHRQDVPPESSTVQELFTLIYEGNLWGSEESLSGFGSTEQATAKLRAGLESLLKRHRIGSVLDIPCGDFRWMQMVPLHGATYLGADIVRSLVDTNRVKYPQYQFEVLDVMRDPLPVVDLVLCRDCLGHLSFEDARQAIQNIARSGSRYLLATTFPKHRNGKVIQTGQWTAYNLQDQPFHLPDPLELIHEDCQECFPTFNDKSLGLWRIEDIAGVWEITEWSEPE